MAPDYCSTVSDITASLIDNVLEVGAMLPGMVVALLLFGALQRRIAAVQSNQNARELAETANFLLCAAIFVAFECMGLALVGPIMCSYNLN